LSESILGKNITPEVKSELAIEVAYARESRRNIDRADWESGLRNREMLVIISGFEIGDLDDGADAGAALIRVGVEERVGLTTGEEFADFMRHEVGVM